MDSQKISVLLISLAEVLAVVGGAVLLTGLLTWPLVPVAFRAELPVRPGSDHSRAVLPIDELNRRFEERGVARHAHVELRDGAQLLVLTGITSPETAEQEIAEILTESGYREEAVLFLPTADTSRLLDSPAKLTASVVIQAAIFLAVGILMVHWRLRPRAPEARGKTWPSVGIGLIGGIAAFALGIGIAYGLELVGFPVEEQAWIEELLSRRDVLIRMLPWILVVIPLSEEVFFRGYVYRFLAERAGFPAGFLASSVLFSLVHFHLSGFLIYLAVGCAFALVYARASNLLAPVVAHVTYNAIAVVFQLFFGDA